MFFTHGFKNWKIGIKKFTKHQKSMAHKDSTCILSSYKSSKEHGTVISELNLGHSITVAENREYIKCLLKTLLFCAKQGIAFRGHDESKTSTNCRNFLNYLS